jgi:glycosyltransferase involved in cell wall biosynthesis
MLAARMRILFLSASLARGGTERQIVALARGLRRRGHEIAVAIFYGGGSFEEDLRSDGIAIHDLGRQGRWDLRFWPRLARLVRSERPDAILAYLGGPNVCSAALKPIVHPVKIVWGIRAALNDLRSYGRQDPRAYDWLARLSPRIESLASVLADGIVANSHAARRQAIANGMNAAKIVVIPNGIDCERFRPDEEGGRRLRREWGIGEGTSLVGMVARLDPVKNHAAFLQAASRVVATSRREVHFVCMGGGDERYRQELEQQAAELGLRGRLTWAGEWVVTRAVYSALDVAVLSSDSESFPNVVAEAMACGTPVVVANSGDVSVIVGNTGVVVPPRDPVALADGILATLNRTEAAGRTIRDEMRERIEREYSVGMLADRTERTLERLVNGG